MKAFDYCFMIICLLFFSLDHMLACECEVFDYTNLFIGSSGFGWGYGAISPAAQVPFGAFRVGPDTASASADIEFRHNSGYNYHDTLIRAFSHTRVVGAGIADYGNFGIMPVRGEYSEPEQYKSWWSSYDKSSEFAQPGYYSVRLVDPEIQVEVVAGSTHAGAHKYTWINNSGKKNNEGLLHSAMVKPEDKPGIVLDVCHAAASNFAMDNEAPYCVDASIQLDPNNLNTFTGRAVFAGQLSNWMFDGTTMIAYVYGEIVTTSGDGVTTWTICNGESGAEQNTQCQKLNSTKNDVNGGSINKEKFRISTESGVLYAYASLADSFDEGGTDRHPTMEIEVHVGISFVSESSAKVNLIYAMSNSTLQPHETTKNSERKVERGVNVSVFGEMHDATCNLWCKEMSTVQFHAENMSALEGTPESAAVFDEDELRIMLYSAYYRSLMSPTIFSEADGSYVGLDKKVHSLKDRAECIGNDCFDAYYSDFSLWDTFRTVLPWQLLIKPAMASAVIRSLSLMTEERGGVFPRWPLGTVETGCMIGLHGGSFVLESLLKESEMGSCVNITSIQTALLAQATDPDAVMGRSDVEWYLTEGYVSYECEPLEPDGKPASLTLSYAFDDYILSGLSEYVGDLNSAASAKERSFNYKNLFDPTMQLMCPRSRDTGELVCPPDGNGKEAWSMFTEGDAFQWTYFVPHDPEGLLKLFSSPTTFQNNLEKFFQDSVDFDEESHFGESFPNPFFWAGNEINLMHLYLFDLAGLDCTRTQYWTRQLLPLHFSTEPNGIPGNDDYGTMSAFLLFTAIGIYPQAGTTRYFIGSPSVSSATISLGDLYFDNTADFSSKLKINAYNNTASNIYVKELYVNGELYSSPIIEHGLLANREKGSETLLEFYMSAEPVSGLCLPQ